MKSSSPWPNHSSPFSEQRLSWARVLSCAGISEEALCWSLGHSTTARVGWSCGPVSIDAWSRGISTSSDDMLRAAFPPLAWRGLRSEAGGSHDLQWLNGSGLGCDDSTFSNVVRGSGCVVGGGAAISSISGSGGSGTGVSSTMVEQELDITCSWTDNWWRGLAWTSTRWGIVWSRHLADCN
jgi:hypothetical protein